MGFSTARATGGRRVGCGAVWAREDAVSRVVDERFFFVDSENFFGGVIIVETGRGAVVGVGCDADVVMSSTAAGVDGI